MAKTTVAELEVRVAELEALVTQLLTIDAYQGRTLAEVRRSDKAAHDRLDAARDVIRGMKGDQAKTTPQTSGKSTPRAKTLQPCTVEGCPGHKLAETSSKHAAYATK